MIMLKICGILALAYAFIAGASNWQRASKKRKFSRYYICININYIKYVWNYIPFK